MDLTPFWRDKNAASSMGSNFGSVPYNNTANGNLSRIPFQLAKLAYRFPDRWRLEEGTHFIGYNEFDFNGTSGSTNLATSNGAIVPRLRLYWADVRKDKIEYLVGQSWSMLTPNRNGLSALPGDLFYGQVIDINYIAGLTWTRQPGMRVLIHPSNHVTFGVSVEQPDQYIGGSAGGSGITLPAASSLSALARTQLDNGQNISAGNYLAEPGFTPDFIAKLALDFSRLHFEVAGIESLTSRLSMLLRLVPDLHNSTHGGGLLVGLNVALLKNFYASSRPTLSAMARAGICLGRRRTSLCEPTAPSTRSKPTALSMVLKRPSRTPCFMPYYGGIYIDRNTAVDTGATTAKIGYGWAGSPNSQNRVINELTFGFNQTMWRNPRYGAINVMGQYEYLEREPWFVAAGTPRATHDNTIYFNIRYTLPGSMPNF